MNEWFILYVGEDGVSWREGYDQARPGVRVPCAPGAREFGRYVFDAGRRAFIWQATAASALQYPTVAKA